MNINSNKPTVLILGGGLAGLSCAIRLLDTGMKVTVLEATPILGGRATSWRDSDGDVIDNGFHVFFPYYEHLLTFYKKLGIEDQIHWKPAAFLTRENGGHQVICRFPALPAPFHLLWGTLQLLRRTFLFSFTDKLAFVWSCLRTALASNTSVENADDLSYAEWTRRSLISSRTPYIIIDSAIRALTFLTSQQVSAKIALKWLRKISRNYHTTRVGIARRGLGELWVKAAQQYILKHGGHIVCSTSAQHFEIHNNKIATIVCSDGVRRTANYYVAAMNVFDLRPIIPPAWLQQAYFRNLHHLKNAPSLTAHLFFDNRITSFDSAAFAHDKIFNTHVDISLTHQHCDSNTGSIFQLVLSPADHLLNLPDEMITTKIKEDFYEIWPEAKKCKLKKIVLLRDRQGVYAALPHMENYRPTQKSPIDHLFLAGDYTSSPIGSGGMETAVWSGNQAAQEVIAQHNKNLNDYIETVDWELPRLKTAVG